MLPAIAFGIALIEALVTRARPAALGLLSVPVLVFQVGWFGAERIWYLRYFRGRSFRPSEVWPFVRAFLGRYLVLGLMAGVVFFPFLFATGALSPSHSGHLSTASFWALVAFSVVLDFLLTFVTPALAFTTRKVWEALGIGIRMIVSEWPRTAPYVLIPPLAIQIVFRIEPRSQFSGSLGVLGAVTGGMLGFAFKGAIARFYLRRHETGDDGAAFLPYSEAPPRPDVDEGPPPPAAPLPA